jgi:hypothetical protein
VCAIFACSSLLLASFIFLVRLYVILQFRVFYISCSPNPNNHIVWWGAQQQQGHTEFPWLLTEKWKNLKIFTEERKNSHWIHAPKIIINYKDLGEE